MDVFDENSNPLKTETIKTPEGCEASFCSTRGGIITSIKLLGKEILYLDEETFKNKEVSVRGGIPILFPNAGPIEGKEFPNLAQHGFARNSSLWQAIKTGNGFEEILLDNQESSASYPYKFKLSIEGKFEENNSFTIHQIVENLETAKDLPISMGLHPYFKVAKEEKKNIKFNFEGGKFIEEQIAMWANGKYISIDNPKLKDASAPLEVVIPNLGTLIIDVSIEYKKIWIWSLPDKDFICIEPVMREVGGLIEDPEQVLPQEVFRAKVNFNLKVD